MTEAKCELLDLDDVSLEEVEDEVIILLTRDTYHGATAEALLAMLKNEREFGIRGRVLNAALKSLRKQKLVYRTSGYWCLATWNLSKRPRHTEE